MVRMAKRYDRIVVLTKADEKRWHTSKVKQIYNPHTITTDKVSDCKNKTVVAVGRMDHQKGFDILIECWQLIEKRHPDWQLRIYGGGDAEPYVRQIKRLGLKTAKVMGRADDVPAVLLNSSIYVLSSRYEGFSLTICEAMICGLPIVTFDCPSGPAELVTEGKNGFIVDKVGDVQTMADRISTLISDEELRQRMGVESKLYSQDYSIDKIMQNWIDMFEELMLC
ncbi:MAG: glycosyltransferase [Bacteroidaceae bacterium]|nr:glycosyltransferase [Bacteroidaceae bacterium]